MQYIAQELMVCVCFSMVSIQQLSKQNLCMNNSVIWFTFVWMDTKARSSLQVIMFVCVIIWPNCASQMVMMMLW